MDEQLTSKTCAEKMAGGNLYVASLKIDCRVIQEAVVANDGNVWFVGSS